MYPNIFRGPLAEIKQNSVKAEENRDGEEHSHQENDKSSRNMERKWKRKAFDISELGEYNILEGINETEFIDCGIAFGIFLVYLCSNEKKIVLSNTIVLICSYKVSKGSH